MPARDSVHMCIEERKGETERVRKKKRRKRKRERERERERDSESENGTPQEKSCSIKSGR